MKTVPHCKSPATAKRFRQLHDNLRCGPNTACGVTEIDSFAAAIMDEGRIGSHHDRLTDIDQRDSCGRNLVLNQSAHTTPVQKQLCLSRASTLSLLFQFGYYCRTTMMFNDR
jgi:hypothetical protein